MTTVTVIGAGYVGLTIAACLAHLGHRVTAVDTDTDRVTRLQIGDIDLLEPALPQMVHNHQSTGALTFTATVEHCLNEAEVTFICLPTPARPDGSADLTTIFSTIPQLRRCLAPGSQLVVKSTVPPGTHHQITAVLGRNDVTVTSNPEFLREGHAVHDWLHPDRIVLGTADPEHTERITTLYSGINAPVVTTDPTSAELIKYAANTFLALKITYANTLAELCEHLGANVTDVRNGLGHDPRIGSHHLRPGPGWGGPCLPKDVRALLAVGNNADCELELLRSVLRSNAHHQRRIVDLIEQLLSKPLARTRVCLLGLTFKPETNDVRNSSALPIATELVARDAQVIAYDPAVTDSVTELPQTPLAPTAAGALEGADAVLVLTEWTEFVALPWHNLARTMRGDLVVDTRGHLNPADLVQAGLRLHTLGDSPVRQLTAKVA
ncbi:UDP-glucose dehydrogenase family protein [Actinopolyspora halophila]|uniref:UDP-glucose dehydrogenase family protein n=1 Tax=Actinopolyspora halophila TaxID=1850 RepID=UPI000364E92B|nr:UDP-glucose/GDP-mannose dehydrogenase family protein [Actinopolyspora halophila]